MPMDTSIIKTEKVTTREGLKIGDEKAPIKIIEFINVRCPYSKKWFTDFDGLLTEQVKAGRLQRIIKLLNKEKDSLQRGNIMHRYIDYYKPDVSLEMIRNMFATQEEWGELSLNEVAGYAENILNLSLPLENYSAITQAIINEATVANIQFIPTILIDNHIFDESISQEQLFNYLQKM